MKSSRVPSNVGVLAVLLLAVALAVPFAIHAGVLDPEYTAPKPTTQTSQSTFTSSSLLSPTSVSSQSFQLSGGTKPSSSQLFSSTPTRSQPTTFSGSAGSASTAGGSSRTVRTTSVSGTTGGGGTNWLSSPSSGSASEASSRSSSSFDGSSTGVGTSRVQVINVVETVCGTVSWSGSGGSVSCSTSGGGCRATSASCTQSQIDEMHQRISSGESVTYTSPQGVVREGTAADLPPESGSSLFNQLLDQFAGFSPIGSGDSSLFFSPIANIVPSNLAPIGNGINWVLNLTPIGQQSQNTVLLAESGLLNQGQIRTRDPGFFGGALSVPGVTTRTAETQTHTGFFTTRSVPGSVEVSYLNPREFLPSDAATVRAQEFAASALEYGTLFGGSTQGEEVANILAAQAAYENINFNEDCNNVFSVACGVGQYTPGTWTTQFGNAVEALEDFAQNGTASEKQAAQALLRRISSLASEGADLRADPTIVAAVMAHHKAELYNEFVEVANAHNISVEAVAQMEHFGTGYYQALRDNPNGVGTVTAGSAFVRQNHIDCIHCTPLEVARYIDRVYESGASREPIAVAENLLGSSERFVSGVNAFDPGTWAVAARQAFGEETPLQAIESAFGGSTGVGVNPGGLLQGFMPLGAGAQQGQGTVNPVGILGTIGEVLGGALSGQPVNAQEVGQRALGQVLELINGVSGVGGGGQAILPITNAIEGFAQQQGILSAPTATAPSGAGVTQTPVSSNEPAQPGALAFGFGLIKGVVDGARQTQQLLGNSRLNLGALDQGEIERFVELGPQITQIWTSGQSESQNRSAMMQLLNENELLGTVMEVLTPKDCRFLCFPELNPEKLGLGTQQQLEAQFGGVRETLTKAFDIVSVLPGETVAARRVQNSQGYFEVYLGNTPIVSHEANIETRDEPNAPEYVDALFSVAQAVDPRLRARIFSGGQDIHCGGIETAECTGSSRHNVDADGYSRTGDVHFYIDGQLVNPGNPAHRDITIAIIKNAVAAGFNEIGIDPRGGGMFHIGKESGSSPAIWGYKTGTKAQRSNLETSELGRAYLQAYDEARAGNYQIQVADLGNGQSVQSGGTGGTGGTSAGNPLGGLLGGLFGGGSGGGGSTAGSGSSGSTSGGSSSGGSGSSGSGSQSGGGGGTSSGSDSTGGGQQNAGGNQILCIIGNLGSLAGGLGGAATQQGLFPALLGNLFGGFMSGLAGGNCGGGSTTQGGLGGVQFPSSGAGTGTQQQGIGNIFGSIFSNFSGFLTPTNTGSQTGQTNTSSGSQTNTTIQPVVTLIPTPIAVETGKMAKLTWASSGVSACKVFDPDGVNIVTGGSTGSFDTLPLAQSVVFRIACKANNGTLVTSAATIIVFGYNGPLADKPLPSNITF